MNNLRKTPLQAAITMGVDLGMLRNWNHERDFLAFVNNALSWGGHPPVSIAELNDALEGLKRCGVVEYNEKEKRYYGYVPANSKGKRTVEKVVEELNGEVIHLVLTQLLTKHGEVYTIQYNIDGKGSALLPDGTKTEEFFNPESHGRDVFNKRGHGRLTGQGGWLGQWHLSLEHHPETRAHKLKKKKGHFRGPDLRKYLDDKNKNFKSQE